MKRRPFISLLGGAARVAARHARAGERCGASGADEPLDDQTHRRISAGLQSWLSVGLNVRIDYRWGGGYVTFSHPPSAPSSPPAA